MSPLFCCTDRRHALTQIAACGDETAQPRAAARDEKWARAGGQAAGAECVTCEQGRKQITDERGLIARVSGWGNGRSKCLCA